MAYQPGVPTGLVPLNQDYLNLQQNFTQINNQYNVDHVPLTDTSGSPPQGYHTIIHQQAQSSVNTIAGTDQLFSGVPGTLIVNGVTTSPVPPNNDNQLFALTGMGGLCQLTGHFAGAIGYGWCSGLLIQWGTTATSVSDGSTINFGIAFPHVCLVVIPTLVITTNNARIAAYQSFSTSGFVVRILTALNVPSSATVSWIAIGA
jgi:hypothetical protein